MAHDAQQDEIEITPDMIEAGLTAYASLAWHDSRSAGSPREIVEAILRQALSVEDVAAPRGRP